MPVASADTLMGLGLPAQLAQLLGGNPSQLTTTGTTQATAVTIKSTNTELLTAASQTGALLPISPDNANVMVPYVITNPTATAGVIYAPVGHTLNGVASSTGQSLAQNKSLIVWQYKPTKWASILTA